MPLSEDFYRPQRSCGKVMSLHPSVILFTGGGGGSRCHRQPPGQRPPVWYGMVLECILVYTALSVATKKPFLPFSLAIISHQDCPVLVETFLLPFEEFHLTKTYLTLWTVIFFKFET